MEPKLGTGKNIFTGKKVTAEDQENALAIGRKAVLYKIVEEILTDKGKAFSFCYQPKHDDKNKKKD
jgi:hypothetical protein